MFNQRRLKLLDISNLNNPDFNNLKIITGKSDLESQLNALFASCYDVHKHINLLVSKWRLRVEVRR